MFNLRNLIYSQASQSISSQNDSQLPNSGILRSIQNNLNSIDLDSQETNVKEESFEDIYVKPDVVIKSEINNNIFSQSSFLSNSFNFNDDISINSTDSILSNSNENINSDGNYVDDDINNLSDKKRKTWLEIEKENILKVNRISRKDIPRSALPLLYRLCPDGIGQRDDNDYIKGINNLNKIINTTSHKNIYFEQKKLLNTLLNELYFAKDYEGSMMTLKTMVDSSDIEIPQLLILIDVLSNLKQQSNQYLSQLSLYLCIKRKEKSTQELRLQLYGIFTNIFIKTQDINFLHEFLMDSEDDGVINDSTLFICISICIKFYYCMILFDEIMNTDMLSKFNMTQLPNDITDNLLDYSIFIHIIYSFNLLPQQLNDNVINDLIIKCKDFMDLLEQLFNKLFISQNILEISYNMQSLYIAYLIGMNQSDAAEQHLKSICFSVSNYHKELKQSAYFYHNLSYSNLYITYICKYKLIDQEQYLSTNISSITIQLLEYLVEYVLNYSTSHQNNESQINLIPSPTPKVIYLSVKLYKLELLDKVVVIDLICNAIENNPSILSNTYTNFQLYLWKSLCCLIGNIDTIDIDFPINSSNNLYNNLYPQQNRNSDMNLFEYLSANYDSVQSNDSFKYYYYDDLNNTYKGKEEDEYSNNCVIEDRKWWTESILSHDQFDNITSCDTIIDDTYYQNYNQKHITISSKNIDQSESNLRLDFDSSLKDNNKNEIIQEIIKLCSNEKINLPEISLTMQKNEIFLQNSNNVIYLDKNMLIMLTYQIIINSYLIGCDSLFTCKGIHIINIHLLQDNHRLNAIYCLDILKSFGINLLRILKLNQLASKAVVEDSYKIDKNGRYGFSLLNVDLCNYFGDPQASLYNPL